jgi:hypothetical protein
MLVRLAVYIPIHDDDAVMDGAPDHSWEFERRLSRPRLIFVQPNNPLIPQLLQSVEMRSLKRVLIIFIFALLVKANAQIPGRGDCTQARDRYADLNDHLLADRQEDSDLSPDASLRGLRT